MSFLAFFGFECPFVIDDAIYDSAADRTGEGCIHVKDELEAIKPMPAAFDHNWAKRLNGTHIKQAATRWDMVEQLRQDIREFKAANNCERIAVLWAASTEMIMGIS
jgi:myo-inositol-1-phosphate synthase